MVCVCVWGGGGVQEWQAGEGGQFVASPAFSKPAPNPPPQTSPPTHLHIGAQHPIQRRRGAGVHHVHPADAQPLVVLQPLGQVAVLVCTQRRRQWRRQQGDAHTHAHEPTKPPGRGERGRGRGAGGGWQGVCVCEGSGGGGERVVGALAAGVERSGTSHDTQPAADDPWHPPPPTPHCHADGKVAPGGGLAAAALQRRAPPLLQRRLLVGDVRGVLGALEAGRPKAAVRSDAGAWRQQLAAAGAGWPGHLHAAAEDGGQRVCLQQQRAVGWVEDAWL